MRAEPRQPERQDQSLGRRRAEKHDERDDQRRCGEDKRSSIDENAPQGGAMKQDSRRRKGDQCGGDR